MSNRAAMGAALGLLLGGLAAEPTPGAVPATLRNTPPNTWVKIDEGSHGTRSSCGLLFLPSEGRFVCFGGAMSSKGAPYSEMTLNLEKGQWENRFPTGKETLWGQPAGPHTAPPYPYGSPPFRDKEGNIRPNLAAGYGNTPFLFHNFAYDSHADRVVALWSLPGLTTEYDVKARSWRVVEGAGEPTLWDAAILGGICYDPVNREALGGHGEWAYKDGAWRRLEFRREQINRLRAKAEGLQRQAQALATACRARYYVTESDQETKRPLGEMARGILSDAAGLAGELKSSSGRAEGHERTQAGWALEALGKAAGVLAKAAESLNAPVAPEAIHAAEDATNALRGAVVALAAVPPRRGFSRMAYDGKNKKIVMFGGHALDRYLADTWVYDCASRTWQERRPPLSPAPRAGHGFAYLPESCKLLLVDGFGCGKRGETWTYDVQANEWKRLKEGGGDRPPITRAPSWGKLPNPFAAGPGGLVVGLGLAETWAARIDTSLVDPDATAAQGVPIGTTRREGEKRDDPRWYEQMAGNVETHAQKTWLDGLPANTWVAQPSPRTRPHQNRAWGTVAIDPDRDQLLHWGGGHVAYTGNAVVHYSLRTNQYYITHPPEFGIVFAHGEGGMPISVTYQGRAFMTGHAYRSYAYDTVSRRLIVCGQSRWFRKNIDRVYFAYDPATGNWRETPIPAPFPVSYATNHCCATPSGVINWAGGELWRLDPQEMKWEKLPLDGKLPQQRPDYHGMAYDSKRDRLLAFCLYLKGDVVAYDLKTGRAAPLEPEGKRDSLALPMREAVYLPAADVVVAGARIQGADGKMRWVLYDCGRNAWLAAHWPGSDPIGGDRRFSAGLGIVHDPRRKLVWAMDSYSRVTVLRPVLGAADLVPVEDLVEAPPKNRR